MNTKSTGIASLIAGTGMLLAASPVFATTIDNIVFPTNPGQHVFAGTISENIVTNVGDELTGGGDINTIEGNTDFCASGTSCSLSYKFGGFMLEEITATSAKFSGGYVNFYANGDESNPFLTTTADKSKGSDYTLEGSLTNGGTQQAQNTAVGLLSVTGGTGASIFDNDTYENGNDDGSKSDLLFNTSLSPEGDGSSTFSGSADAHYTSVPEPSDLGILLFGLGLIGSSALLRRRRSV